LLWDITTDGPLWVSPYDFVRNVPTFCRYVQRYPPHGLGAILDESLADFLGIPIWSDELHLSIELRYVENEPWSRHSDYSSYQAMQRLVKLAPTSHGTKSCPTWIQGIMQLSIFPITEPDQTRRRAPLDDRTFVPDSARLNKSLSSKVRLLDFRGKDILKLIQLFRWAYPSLKYFSSYEDEKYIKIVGQDSVFTEAMTILDKSKKFAARYQTH